MIVSIGTDLCEVPRLAKVRKQRGTRFEKRIYTRSEQEYCRRRAEADHSFAARFAAKEAVMKALGTGWRHGVRWVDIEVVRQPGQAPYLQLHGRTAEIAREKGITRLHLSLTHTDASAMAFVVAENVT